MAGDITIRQLQREELHHMVEWTVAEYWHISDNIALASYLLDPQGFFAAVNSKGEVVGCIGGCALNDKVASGGLYIVRKDWRGKGAGKKLWDARINYLGTRNLGITAVEARIEADKRHGFVHMSFEVASFTGLLKTDKLLPIKDQKLNIIEYKEDMFDDVLKYDSVIQTVPRAGFLKQWMCPSATRSFVAKHDGKIVGFGCIQKIPCNIGHHTGPWFADSPEIARMLFNNLANTVPEGEKIAFDAPLDNKLSMSIVSEHDLSCDLKLIRMYNKGPYPLSMKNVYGITTCGVSLI